MVSILRGSILYNCETYYKMSENEYQRLQSIEESFLRQIFKTGQNCPKHLLWLELGQVPTKYLVKQYKLIYLKHIIEQGQNSLLKRFFDAQYQHRTKGDWVSEVLDTLTILDIPLTLPEIRDMNAVKYRRLIKEKIRKYAFEQLIKKQKNGSKGVEIDYGKYIQTQPYLLPNEILTIDNQIKLFSYRCRMNTRNYNFPSDKKEEICLCGKYVLTNDHLYHCNIL